MPLKQQNSPPPGWINANEVMQLLDLDQVRMAGLVRRGQLPTPKIIDGEWYFQLGRLRARGIDVRQMLNWQKILNRIIPQLLYYAKQI